MTRSTTATGLLLAVVLLSGCATTSLPGQDDELVERVRQALSTDPQLNTSMVTVTERDGVIVIGGFAESLADINVIRDAIEEVEGVASVRNEIVLQGETERDGASPFDG